MTLSAKDITQLLRDWSKGDRNALDRLTPIIYEELRQLASSHMRRERPEHTLQTTGLIHEAYLRLVEQRSQEWESRAHFFGVAAHLMRMILVDYARKRTALKRDGGRQVTLEEAPSIRPERVEDLLALESALEELGRLDERKCRIVEMRYFSGLSADEITEVTGLSAATVRRDLRMAKAWIHHRLGSM
jgi:RNA polymerase sigma factor (TIGR02999 family)